MAGQARLRPLEELGVAAARGLRGVLTDVDDTLTDAGKLVPEAYDALCRLKDAGLRVVVVTGRPGGWADVLFALWPIDAMVAEGGAVAGLRDGRRLWWMEDEVERTRRRHALAQLVDEARAQFPFARLARDERLRLVDVAFDVGEHEHLAPEQIELLVRYIRERGFRTEVSSVHAHACPGSYDKATMTLRLLATLWQETTEEAEAHYLYVGDSLNDQSGFAAFSTSVGVANIVAYVGRLAPPPRFVTQGRGGHGFAELTAHLLKQRRIG